MACSLIICVFILYLNFPKLSNIYKKSLLCVNGHFIVQFIRQEQILHVKKSAKMYSLLGFQYVYHIYM